MEIKAVKFRKDGFYTQPFVMGGEDGADKFDKNTRYRGSLQNYLIDTGNVRGANRARTSSIRLNRAGRRNLSKRWLNAYEK